MAKKSLISPWSAVWLALPLACGDDGSTTASATQATTNTTPACVTEGCATTGDPPTSTVSPTSGSGSTTGNTGDSTTTTTSTDTTTGEPLECRFAPGCHKPAAPSSDRGLASHVPIGCDGPLFSLGWSVAVASYADPEAPRSIPMLADFDADGLTDLFINMRKASAALIFRGLGGGSFDAQPVMLTGGLFAGGWGGDLGDLDSDGDLDVLVGDHVRGAFAWLNAPGLVFTPAITGLPPADVLFSGGGLADLDGDGTLDGIFGADQFSKGYHTFKGAGGTWTEIAGPTSAKAMNVGHIVFADYDDDGDLDVFAFGEGSAVALDIYVYRNDRAGFVEVVNIPAGVPEQINADPVQGSVADINCDGTLDIAAGGNIFLGADGSWSLAAEVDASHIGHLADMNGDGHLDLVTQDPTVGLAVYHGDGTGMTFTLAAAGLPDAGFTYQGVTMNTAYGIDIADVGGDSALDIVRVAGFGEQFAIEVYVR